MCFPLIADLSFLKSLLPIMQFAHVLVLKSCAEFIVLINMHCASSLWGACFSARREVICLYLWAVPLPKISQQWRAVLTDPEPVDLADEHSHDWTQWFHTILFWLEALLLPLIVNARTLPVRQWPDFLAGVWDLVGYPPCGSICGVRSTHRTPTRLETQAGAFMICKQ